jgi:hypothetical protein
MLKIEHKYRHQIASHESCAKFQQSLERAYNVMCFGRTPNRPKNQGIVLFEVFRKPKDNLEFLLKFYDEWADRLASLIKDKSQYAQVFETLKNAAAHGGDALIVIKRYRSVKTGLPRTITEATVWDNGPGLKDIERCLQQGYSSNPDEFNAFAGLGRGMDMVIGLTPVTFAAHELIVQSGQERVWRKHPTDSYHLEFAPKTTPGTKVTLRFWSK